MVNVNMQADLSGNIMNSYFPHDSNARNSDKVIKLRMRHKSAGYGVYFMILERLRDSEDYTSPRDYNVIAYDLREDASLIKSVVEDFGLFTISDDGKYFYSEEFRERMAIKDSVSEKRAEAGRIAAAKRWQTHSNRIANALQTHNTPNAVAMPNKIKENKSKDIKENNTEVLQKKSYRFSPPTLEEIKAYILEKGYSVDADRFFNFYESKGWYVGKNKMKDWKAAVRTWTNQEKKTGFDTGIVLTDNSTAKYEETWNR